MVLRPPLVRSTFVSDTVPMHESAPKLYHWLRRHTIVCFLLMTVSFIAFGLLTVDLVRLIAANTDLVFSYGINGLLDGGLRQLVELWLGALLAMALYMVFKLCEQVILHVLLGTNAPKEDTRN